MYPVGVCPPGSEPGVLKDEQVLQAASHPGLLGQVVDEPLLVVGSAPVPPHPPPHQVGKSERVAISRSRDKRTLRGKPGKTWLWQRYRNKVVLEALAKLNNLDIKRNTDWLNRTIIRLDDEHLVRHKQLFLLFQVDPQGILIIIIIIFLLTQKAFWKLLSSLSLSLLLTH